MTVIIKIIYSLSNLRPCITHVFAKLSRETGEVFNFARGRNGQMGPGAKVLRVVLRVYPFDLYRVFAKPQHRNTRNTILLNTCPRVCVIRRAHVCTRATVVSVVVLWYLIKNIYINILACGKTTTPTATPLIGAPKALRKRLNIPSFKGVSHG